MFKEKEDKIAIESISRSHCVEKLTPNRGPRDIIVRFVSYRDLAIIYGDKRNLKAYNPSKQTGLIFISDALISKRAF